MVCLRMESGKSGLLSTFNWAAKEDSGYLQWAMNHASYSKETNMTKSLHVGSQNR